MKVRYSIVAFICFISTSMADTGVASSSPSAISSAPISSSTQASSTAQSTTSVKRMAPPLVILYLATPSATATNTSTGSSNAISTASSPSTSSTTTTNSTITPNNGTTSTSNTTISSGNGNITTQANSTTSNSTSSTSNSTAVASSNSTQASNSTSTTINSNSTSNSTVSSNTTSSSVNSTPTGNSTLASTNSDNSTISSNSTSTTSNSTSISNTTIISKSALIGSAAFVGNSTTINSTSGAGNSTSTNSTAVILKICPSGSVSDPTGVICIACPGESLACAFNLNGTAIVATLCKPPFILSNGLCVYVPTCPVNALDCGPLYTTPVPAFSCMAGYALVSGTTCVACYSGTFALAGSTSCAACDSLGVLACSSFNGDATSCLPGFNLTAGSCDALNSTTNITAALHPSKDTNHLTILPCTVGRVRIENSADGCVICGNGAFQCNGTWPNNITILSCQSGFSFLNATCTICPIGLGSSKGNTDSECHKCRNSGSTRCSISSIPARSYDLACKSGFYLKKGRICGVCPPGSSTLNDNSLTSCQACPGKGTKHCDLAVNPVAITSCMPTYKFSLLYKVGTCTFIAPKRKSH